jgi:exodeoxyribonuclease V alpha subunit
LHAKGSNGEPVTVVGAMAAIQPGESVRLDGVWSTHPQYGRQFKFTRYTLVYPATVEGVRKYLGSGLIKGIGPVTAKRIVEHFQLDTLEVIDQAPDRLLEVPGIGPKRVAIIKKGWETQKQIKDVMIFLQSHGVSTGYSVRIYKQYGTKAISLVRANPYRLEQDIFGVGFLTADRIAQRLGIGEAAPARLKAGLRYVLNQASEQGHVFLPRDELLQAAQQELTVDGSLILPQITELAREEGVVVEGDRVYLPVLYHAESGVASSLCRLLRDPPPPVTWDVPAAIKALGRGQGIQYDETQIQALRMAVQSKVMVLTGGPGTGKTTITRGIIGLLQQQHLGVLLCSPTGRAAKKLSEATGREAKTIHRLLGFKPPHGFEHDQNRPLRAGAVIVDEASMIDIALMHSLLKAVPTAARLVLVGDIDQLPSVGPGSVLRDLIDSGVIPVVRLTHIFRQAQQSHIITNAHRINQGELPHVDNQKALDFFFCEEEEPDRVAALIQELCSQRLPQRYGLDPIEDSQVLCPMYKGVTGATHLNQVLQQSLNPNGQSWTRGGTDYRVGDKVMQTRNNYDKSVFNGDVGRIRTIDVAEQTVTVAFDVVVEYEFGELDELVLAYAVSVHKSQGSEYRAVLMPITTQHYMMLQRNLLYTAITRAKELVVLVGTKKALAIAVRNDQIAQRHTALAERLQPMRR